jgi:heme-degrading monooxygenase HmoA
MIFEVNEVEIAIGRAGVFERAFAEAAPLLLAVRGCRSAALFRCIERPDVYQIRIGWERLNDHVDHYPGTEEAAQVRALLRPLIAASRAAHFEEVTIAAQP